MMYNKLIDFPLHTSFLLYLFLYLCGRDSLTLLISLCFVGFGAWLFHLTFSPNDGMCQVICYMSIPLWRQSFEFFYGMMVA